EFAVSDFSVIGMPLDGYAGKIESAVIPISGIISLAGDREPIYDDTGSGHPHGSSLATNRPNNCRDVDACTLYGDLLVDDDILIVRSCTGLDHITCSCRVHSRLNGRIMR